MRKAYEEWLGKRGDSAANQLAYVANEIRTGKHIGSGNASKIRKAFNSGKVDDATRAFCNYFERPNPKLSHMVRRIIAARKYESKSTN